MRALRSAQSGAVLAVVGGLACLAGGWFGWVATGFEVIRGIETAGAVSATAALVALLVLGTWGSTGRWTRVAGAASLLAGLVAVGTVAWFLWAARGASVASTMGSGLPGAGLDLTAVGGGLLLVGGLAMVRAVDQTPSARKGSVRLLGVGFLACALLAAAVWAGPAGAALDHEYRSNCGLCVPQASVTVSADAGSDAVTLTHQEGHPLTSRLTRVVLTVDGEAVELPATAETAAGSLRPGDAVTFRFDGSSPSAPWAGYGPIPTRDLTDGEELRVQLIHTGAQTVVVDETVTVSGAGDGSE